MLRPLHHGPETVVQRRQWVQRAGTKGPWRRDSLLLIAALLLSAPPEARSEDAPRRVASSADGRGRGPWIGAYGDETVPTPRLDAFAAESLRYDNAFVLARLRSGPHGDPDRRAPADGRHARVRSRSAAGDEAYAGIPLYEAVPRPSSSPSRGRSARRLVRDQQRQDGLQFKAPADTWDASSKRSTGTGRTEPPSSPSTTTRGRTSPRPSRPRAARAAGGARGRPVPHLSGHARRCATR